MSPSKSEAPRRSAGDAANALMRAGLGSLPIVGGAAAEFWSFVMAPPLERRREEWLESIAREIEQLKASVEGLTDEDLANNALFVTTVLRASQSAMLSHQGEKLDLLRNAVLNSAAANPPDDDEAMMFLAFVDAFTPWHVRILRYLDAPTEHARADGIAIAHRADQTITLALILEENFPELRGREQFYSQIVRDLFARGLVVSQELYGKITVQGSWESRTTPFGARFLRFVASPRASA